MAKRTILSLLVLAALAATPAQAQSISSADWARFLEESYSPYGGEEDDPKDWEDLLYDAGQDTGQAQAIARFGQQIGAPPAEAERYAAVIVASVIARACEMDCPRITPGDPAFDAIMGPALAEPSGELLWRVGANLGTEYARIGPGAFLNAIWDHPARKSVVARLHAYGEYDVFLLPLVLETPLDPAALTAVGKVDVKADGGADHWDGWRLAALEAAADKARAEGATAEQQALYAQVILAQYFNLGLTEQGLALWRATPAEVRAQLPLSASTCGSNDEEGRRACAMRVSGETIADEVTAALWLADEQDQARAWLTQAEARLGPLPDWSRRPAHMALVDALDRTRPAPDLFPLLVRGDPLPDAEGHGPDEDEAWAFTALGPAAQRLVIDRVRQAGYGPIAADMEARATYFRSLDYGGDLARMADMLAPFADRRAELAAAIDAAWKPGQARRFDPRAMRPVRPLGWTEARLPAGIEPWAPPPPRADDAHQEPPSAPLPPGGVAPPLSPYAVLRHEVVDGEQIVLFMSSEYDLPGELPAPGVWMLRTEGGAWGKPAYLGLQQHFPYVVTPASAVPLLANGKLTIEVQAREIDPASITFPPVGLRLAREERGLVIERDLADLMRDTDADGMTDVAERRVGLDPAAADTDGDGRLDGADPVPLTAWSPDIPPARNALARVILQRLTGHDEGAIVVPAELPEEFDEALLAMVEAEPPAPRPSTIQIVGDPTLFAGLEPPFQLLVYTPEQIARLADGAPPSFPPEVTVYSSLDGLEHLVVWSASWTGGRFTVRCPADGSACEVEELSNWIT